MKCAVVVTASVPRSNVEAISPTPRQNQLDGRTYSIVPGDGRVSVTQGVPHSGHLPLAFDVKSYRHLRQWPGRTRRGSRRQRKAELPPRRTIGSQNGMNTHVFCVTERPNVTEPPGAPGLATCRLGDVTGASLFH